MRARAMYLVAAIGVITACVMLPGPVSAATVPPPVTCNTGTGSLLASGARQSLAVPAAGRRGLCLDRRHQREHLRVPVHRRSRGHPSVFDIDLYVDPAIAGNNTTFNTAAVNAIHANGAKAICYVSAGTFEPWRPDVASYPDSIKGRAVGGFKDEKWVDIRQTSILLPIMNARVAKCKQAGFDGVEWDTVDGYTNRTGFPLTASDQLVLQREPREPGALLRAHRGVEERRRAAARPGSVLRLRGQRAVPAVQRVRRLHDVLHQRRARPCSRSSTSSGRRSSARKPTPRTATRSRRRSTCSTRPGRPADRSIRRGRRRNALREPEHVVGVVAALDLDEPVEVRAVVGVRPTVELRVDVVDVGGATGRGAQRAPHAGEPATVRGDRGIVGHRGEGHELLSEELGLAMGNAVACGPICAISPPQASRTTPPELARNAAVDRDSIRPSTSSRGAEAIGGRRSRTWRATPAAAARRRGSGACTRLPTGRNTRRRAWRRPGRASSCSSSSPAVPHP